MRWLPFAALLYGFPGAMWYIMQHPPTLFWLYAFFTYIVALALVGVWTISR